MVDTRQILSVLGFPSAAGSESATDVARDLVRRGMPASVLSALAGHLKVSIGAIQMLAGIPAATAARKRSTKQLLQPILSDRLFRIASVYALAKEVLESGDAAAEWLSESNRALNGRTPLELLDTEIGTREVELILQRLEHGVYS
jgi:putative toxin-antitoxin system antitoxin component (TIGR02293 family)